MPQKRVLYGVANYAEVITEHGYFVDKTAFIAQLEVINNPIFLRPRRFGKSLLCSMLGYYYDLGYAAEFEVLFGQTWIGQNPTPHHNSYFILPFDFSPIEASGNIDQIEHNFKQYCNFIIDGLRIGYPTHFHDLPPIELNESVATNLGKLFHYIRLRRLPPIYITIDEYDNFANQLVTSHKDELYQALTAEDSFLKTFFKALKEGRKLGAITNIFITGVLPIMIDDLASGYNIAKFITLDSEFETMLGFTQAEVDHLVDEIYRDYEIDPHSRAEVNNIIKNYYNGYCFVNPHGEALYNSTILMYFLLDFSRYKTIPDYLIDLNLKTDLSWVRRLTGANPANTEAFVNQLITQNSIVYNKEYLVSKFNMYQFFDQSFYPISFYYLGMLTKQDDFELCLPNLNMRQIFVGYFNELHQLDVSTRYVEMMSSFVHQPDLPKLFADYWRLYVSQLPEVIFQQVNENFYRTTFFQLCSSYLSTWFTWNVERSYPRGKSDLEFVGKYHEKFAGLRYVIEFKYYSNSEFKRKFKFIPIEAFTCQAEDMAQITEYVNGLKREYPEARISQFVIYCIGNQGFRVFALTPPSHF